MLPGPQSPHRAPNSRVPHEGSLLLSHCLPSIPPHQTKLLAKSENLQAWLQEGRSPVGLQLDILEKPEQEGAGVRANFSICWFSAFPLTDRALHKSDLSCAESTANKPDAPGTRTRVWAQPILQQSPSPPVRLLSSRCKA